MAERRVVVTGIGAVSAAGIGAKALWQAARDGRSCVREAIYPRPYPGRIKMAAQVSDFDATKLIEPDILPLCDPVTRYLIVATDEAVTAAGTQPPDCRAKR
jgi:nodulation protein E